MSTVTVPMTVTQQIATAMYLARVSVAYMTTAMATVIAVGWIACATATTAIALLTVFLTAPPIAIAPQIAMPTATVIRKRPAKSPC